MNDDAMASVSSVEPLFSTTRSQGVHKAMAAVQAELSKIGIAKLRTANTGGQGGSFNFRGIDDVYNTVSPLFARHGLLMIPKILSRSVAERISSNNRALFVVTVEVVYRFVAVEDGSTLEAGPFYGEAMDSGDKATNKAMSAAHKYAVFQTFSIPTEGTPDADEEVHEVQAELTAEQSGVLRQLRDAADEGTKKLEKAWREAGLDNRKALASHLEGLKERAAKVDAGGKGNGEAQAA